MTIFICFHTYGGNYTFELAPFDYFNNLLYKLNLDIILPDGRNNFDRVAHFLVGVFAFPIAEFVYRKKMVNSLFFASFFGVVFIGFWAAFYEIIEMLYAISYNNESGAAFLGSQGDIWDAQNDMLLDITGAILFSVVFYFIFRKKDKIIS